MRSAIEGILTGKTKTVYCEVLDALSDYSSPSGFIEAAWTQYKQVYPSTKSVNGRIFEYLLFETLIRSGIQPIYFQAKFPLIPNCEFDIVLYHPQRPIVLSAKTSLRERYKQADLEGMALKNVYRQARQHLITLSEEGVSATRSKIERGDIVGLESVVVANKPEYDALLSELGAMEFQYAEAILPLSGKTFPRQST